MSVREAPLVFETDDRDEAHGQLLSMYVEHDLRIASPHTAFGCRVRAVPADRIVLAAIEFGTDIVIDAPAMDDCYQINVAVHGACRVRQSGASASHLEHAAFVMRPDRPLLMDWSGGTAHHVMKIPAAMIRERAARLAGRESADDLDFPLSFPVDTGVGASFAAMVAHVYRELARPDGIASVPQARRELESSLVTQFLCAAPSGVTRLLGAEWNGDACRRARLAADFIDGHPTLDLELSDLTAHAGVGVRTLQRAFVETFGVPPLAYVRRARLERVRADLCDGRGTVGEIAARWGFYHPGRFASQYRDRYGEAPSETRAKSLG